MLEKREKPICRAANLTLAACPELFAYHQYGQLSCFVGSTLEKVKLDFLNWLLLYVPGRWATGNIEIFHDCTATRPRYYKEVFVHSFVETAARPNNYFLVHWFRWNL